MSLPNLIYQSGTFTAAVACSLPVFECPFADLGLNDRLILRQDFHQNVADFNELALLTPHPTYSDFLLVEEGGHSDVTGGKVRWTRTYAKVPSSFQRPAGNYIYTFPGYTGALGLVAANTNDREPFIETVPMEILRDFSTDKSSLPYVQPTRYHLLGYPTAYVNLLDDGPPDGLFTIATVPSRTEYEAMIAADAADPDSFSIIVECRGPEIWMGGIYVRETMKIKAI